LVFVSQVGVYLGMAAYCLVGFEGLGACWFEGVVA